MRVIIWIFYLFFFFSSLHAGEKPNIIWILSDSLRYDHMSLYGYPRKTTPFLEGISQELIIFSQAISPSTVTIISLPSLFTSTYTRHLVSHWKGTLNPRLKTFPQIIKRKGWKTAFISGHGIIGDVRGLARGFDYFIDNRRLKGSILVGEAGRWISSVKDKPFFLYLHFMDTHGPYNSPPSFYEDFLEDSLYRADKRLSPGKTDEGREEIPRYVYVEGRNEVDYYIARYDGAIGYVDRNLRELVAFLKREKLWEKTILVFTADHGEYMGEHGLYFVHGNEPYEVVVRVPLIFRIPGIKGKKISSPVSTMDIVPTLLNLLSIEPPSYMEGMSLLPLIANKEYPSREFLILSGNPQRGTWFTALRTSTHKLIHTGKGKKEWYLLYNLLEDPQESHPLPPKGEVFEKLQKKLTAREKKAREDLVSYSPYLDEETRKLLRSLGYVQ